MKFQTTNNKKQINFKFQILPKACLRQKLQTLLNKSNIDILVIVICDLFVFWFLVLLIRKTSTLLTDTN